MKTRIVILIMCSWVVAQLYAAQSNVRLDNIRTYAYPEYTRVVLDLSAALTIKEKILKGETAARLYFDLPNCIFGQGFPEEKKKELLVKAGNLKRIRVGVPGKATVRIVFDFDKIGNYHFSYLRAPFRIVVDIFQNKEYVPFSKQPYTLDLTATSTTTTVQLPPPLTDTQLPLQTANTQLPPPVNDGDKPSIARQLGLKAHRIILDPGHGGKDPGTINHELNIQEKEMTLDIAKRLNTLLSESGECEVILTRQDDTYISLEERTAIANSQKGDLFVSIHINSARRRTAHGIETFYLSFTSDPWAMSVAAQENAISNKSLGELRSILDGIIKTTNISESRILSSCLQQYLVDGLTKKFKNIDNLGVKKAPFYVLVGAKMPAALVEVSFLSFREEAQRLATPDYRQTIASGLHAGILSFIKSFQGNETK